MPRPGKLWVTDTLQWRQEAGPAARKPDAGFSFLLFVATCLSNQFASPVGATAFFGSTAKQSAERMTRAVGQNGILRTDCQSVQPGAAQPMFSN
jgi:hypothetical protein